MKKILFFALLIFSSYSVFAQNAPLVYHSQSKKVYRNDSLCNMDVLFQMMRPNEEAFKLIVSARDYRFFSTIFGAVGGGVMGFPIGAFIVTGNFNWTVFSIGAGLTGISLALHLKHLQQTQRAVIAYNGTLNHSFRPRSELGLRFSLNGIGLMLSQLIFLFYLVLQIITSDYAHFNYRLIFCFFFRFIRSIRYNLGA